MNKAEWQKGVDAWKNIHKQAEIDMEQATIYIEALENKIKSLPDEETEVK